MVKEVKNSFKTENNKKGGDMMGFHKNLKKRIAKYEQELDEFFYQVLEELDRKTNEILKKMEVEEK